MASNVNWYSGKERANVFDNLKREEIPMKDIYLDPQNPRIRIKKPTSSDSEIPQKNIQDHCNKQIDEDSPSKNENLKEKLLAMGFRTDGDALYVKPLDGKPGGYLALEGNRRTRFVKQILEEITGGVHAGKSKDWEESFEKAWCLVYTGKNPHAAAILQSHRHLGGGKSSDWGPIRRAEHYKLIRDTAEASGLKTPNASTIAAQEGESDSTKVKNLLLSLDGMDAANQLIAQSAHKFKDLPGKNGFGWFNEVIFQGEKRLREGYLGWDQKTRDFTEADNVRSLAKMINSANPQIINSSVFRDRIKDLFEPDGTPSSQWENMDTDSSYTMETAIANIISEKQKATAEKKAKAASLMGYNKKVKQYSAELGKLPTLNKAKAKTIENTINLLKENAEASEDAIDTLKTYQLGKQAEIAKQAKKALAENKKKCKSKTLQGKDCSKNAQEGSDYCSAHNKNTNKGK